MSSEKIRVAAYCRVATRNQIDDSPLDMQSARLHRYAQSNGLEIIGEVRVYEKGLTMDRPGWNEVLKLAARERVDALLVTELGRVARDPRLVLDTLKSLSAIHLKVFSADLRMTTNIDLYKKICVQSERS